MTCSFKEFPFFLWINEWLGQWANVQMSAWPSPAVPWRVSSRQGARMLNADIPNLWQLRQWDVGWGGDTTYICSSRLPSNGEALEIGMELMENQRARHKPVMDYPSPIRPTRLGTRASTKEHKAQESSCIGIQSGVRPFSDIFHCSSKASSSAALCWWVKCTIKKFSSYFLPTKQIPPLNRFLSVPLFSLNYFCSWYFFSVGILQICIINFISLFF